MHISLLQKNKGWGKPLLGSLRFRLFLLVLIAVFPFIGLTLYVNIQGRKNARINAQQDALRLVRIVVAEQEESMKGVKQLLVALAQLPELKEGDPAAYQSLFNELMAQYPFYSALSISTLDGEVVCSVPPITAPTNFSDRSWFQQVLQTNTTVVSEYVIGWISDKSIIVVAHPVINTSNNTVAIISIGLDLSWLNQIITDAELPPNSAYTVIDPSGTVLARYPDPEDWVGENVSDELFTSEILSTNSAGVLEAKGIDGVERVYAFAPIENDSSPSSYISIGIPSEIAYSDANEVLVTNLIGLALVSVLVSATVWLISERLILRRVKALKMAIKQIETGDLSARTGLPHEDDEIGNLARSFDKMGEALQEREIEVKRSAEQIMHQLISLNALRNIDMAITSSIDLRVTLNVLLDEVTKTLEVDAACVLLFDPYTQTLECSVRRGFKTGALQKTRLQLGESFAGRSALERQIEIIHNLKETERDGFQKSPQFPMEGFVSYVAAPLVAKGQIKGVLELFQRTHLEPNQEWLDFLGSLAMQAAIAIDNAALFDNLQQANINLINAYDTTLDGWSQALDLRDRETEGHTKRVTGITLKLAHAMGIKSEELLHMRRGAMLHDIGKMGIPDNILHKPDQLTEEEWETMREHPAIAFRLLSPIKYLQPALDIPYCHHEKWDGSGYPRGLKGDQIPLAARIFAIADVWDALRSDRPYRKAWDEKKTLTYIQEQSGIHFDPKVVEAFFELYRQGNLR